MGFGESSFRSRAASLLRPSTYSTTQSTGQCEDQEKGPGITLNTPVDSSQNEKTRVIGENNGLEQSETLSPGGTRYSSSGNNAVANNRAAQRIVRTIPSWVHTPDEEEVDVVPAADSLPHIPAGALIAQHNKNTSVAPSRQPGSSRGRLNDNGQDLTPPFNRDAVHESGSRWRAFASSSAYPTFSAEGGEIVTEEWLEQNGPDYSRPWLAGATDGDPEKDPAGLYRFRVKRRAWYIRAQRTVLRNPVVPMVIRMNVWFFSAVALALACSIHHLTARLHGSGNTPSTNMAIVVDAIALVYLLYITYDEYSGKPLGLRPARAKMRLIFLDLFFIVFDSANLSLAFETVEGGRKNSNTKICSLQKALASVLLIALVAWLLTFSISVMRLVERVATR